MSSVKTINLYFALILVVSIVGILLITIGSFAAFYLMGYGSGYRYSCLTCEYSTPVDLAAQIVILILLVIQIIIAVNELLPNKFISMELARYGIIIALLTLIFAIIGGISFGVTYSEFEWWFETGFYGGVACGIINMILFFLERKYE
jgi:Na+-transporting NADH:ubiquinone oxidoreductase subunit NqrE